MMVMTRVTYWRVAIVNPVITSDLTVFWMLMVVFHIPVSSMPWSLLNLKCLCAILLILMPMRVMIVAKRFPFNHHLKVRHHPCLMML